MKRFYFAWVWAMVLTPLVAQTSQESLSALALKITEKRSQVEALTSELELLKTSFNEDLRSLAAQKADVETQINREKLRIDQLERDLAEVRQRLSVDQGQLADSLPLVVRVLERLRMYVSTALPFQREGRLAEVDTLIRLADGESIEPGTLLARVWNLMESEYRLSGENGLYRQSLVIEGREQRVEVARLGMVFLYFRTPDGRVGMAVPGAQGWSYRVETNTERRKAIESLMDSLRKNLKEGYFVLPYPYAQEVSR